MSNEYNLFEYISELQISPKFTISASIFADFKSRSFGEYMSVLFQRCFPESLLKVYISHVYFLEPDATVLILSKRSEHTGQTSQH